MNPETNQPKIRIQDKIADRIYFEKSQQQTQRPVEDEYGLSNELLRNEPLPTFVNYESPIDKDSIKANVNPIELSATRLNAIQASLLGFYGRLLNVDLSPVQIEMIHINSIINNTSRGKGGWAGYLSKTSKSVSETTLVEKANEINKQEEKKSLIDKIIRR